MVNRMRATRAHRGNRRSHHALENARFSKCENCSETLLRHHMCTNCGKYKGKVVTDVKAAITKKEKKTEARKKEAAAQGK